MKLPELRQELFYRGIVEDNKDPERLGRVKVRIFGIHPDDEKVTKEMLPWAEVIRSSSLGLISGIGLSSVLPQGTVVWCFLENGDFNFPVVFGVSSGIHKTKDTGPFSDPDSEYPIEDRLEDSDFSLLTDSLEEDKLDKYPTLKTRKESNITGIPDTTGETWDEPLPTNDAAVYPYNKVLETKAGHIIELDDTENNERIHIIHKSGSYIEMDSEGNINIKSSKNVYKISTESHYEMVGLDKRETVNGDTYLNKTGKLEEKIGSSVTFEVAEQRETQIGADDMLMIAGNSLEAVDGNMEKTSSGNVKIEAGGTGDIEIAAVLNVKGSIINLN